MGIYADQRIGEILRELPTGHGNRFSDTSETLKADAIADAGIPKSQAYDLQKLAANPDVVQAVLDKAEQGRPGWWPRVCKIAYCFLSLSRGLASR